MYPVEFKGHSIVMMSRNHPDYKPGCSKMLYCGQCGILYEEDRGKYCVISGDWDREYVHVLPSCDEYKMRDALE